MEFHGLISVPRGFAGPGIYWLRLWARDDSHVAVVTEVPGNPGLSVCNGIEEIREHLVEHFGVDSSRLQLFEIHPTDCWSFGREAERMRIDFTPSAEFTDVTLDQIVIAVGNALPPLPAHADLYAQVREAGGGVFQSTYWHIYKAVPVEEIPVPHNPSGCAHYERFRMLGSDGKEGESVGRRFLETLTEADRGKCRFHEADWRWIAEQSVRIITELGHVESGKYVDAVDRIKRRRKDRSWLRSLFFDPIVIAGGSFSNGQHRACALRFSGASHAAMVIGDDERGAEEEVWVYQGDG